MNSTGDIDGALKSLQREMKHCKYPGSQQIDWNAVRKGSSVELLPILHFLLLNCSVLVSTFLNEKGYILRGSTDLKFVETIFRILRADLKCSAKLVLTPEKFCSNEKFAEHKIKLCSTISRLIRKKHRQLLKQTKATRKSGKTQLPNRYTSRPSRVSSGATSADQYPNVFIDHATTTCRTGTTSPLRPRSPLRLVHTPPAGSLTDAVNGLTKNCKPVRGTRRVLDLSGNMGGGGGGGGTSNSEAKEREKVKTRVFSSEAPTPSKTLHVYRRLIPSSLSHTSHTSSPKRVPALAAAAAAAPPPPPPPPLPTSSPSFPSAPQSVTGLETRLCALISTCFTELNTKIEHISSKVNSLETRFHLLEETVYARNDATQLEGGF
jgi:hypothetical protein